MSVAKNGGGLLTAALPFGLEALSWRCKIFTGGSIDFGDLPNWCPKFLPPKRLPITNSSFPESLATYKERHKGRESSENQCGSRIEKKLSIGKLLGTGKPKRCWQKCQCLVQVLQSQAEDCVALIVLLVFARPFRGILGMNSSKERNMPCRDKRGEEFLVVFCKPGCSVNTAEAPVWKHA